MFAWFVIAVLLVASLGFLAARLPQFALLAAMPAAFLIVVKFAAVSEGISTIFWLLWLLGLIVAIVAAVRAGFFTALVVFVIGILLVIVYMAPFKAAHPAAATGTTAEASANVGGEQARQAADAGTGTKPATCDAQYAQDWDPNKEFRFASNGLWDDASKKTISVDGASARQKALVGHDARYLAGSAWSVGLWDDPNKVAPLLTADKKCLSTEGIQLDNQLVQKWDSAKAEIGQAPADGVNTGSDNGTYVVNAASGITGDRTALVRTYPDGSKSYDLARCGNNVLPAPPRHVPHGRTDHTPPPSTPSSSPPTVPPTVPPTTPPPTTPPPTTPPPTTPPPTTPPCEWDHSLPANSPKCLKPKDPGDSLPGPTGKPTAPAPTEPAETAPPTETKPADPAEKPGDPAPPDVVAPGATQEPTKESTPAPLQTVAPPPTDPGTSISDPDGTSTQSNKVTTQSDSSGSGTTSQDQGDAPPAGSPAGAADSAPPTGQNNAMGMFALPLLGLGALGKKRKLFRK